MSTQSHPLESDARAQAALIGGAAWDDRERVGTLSEQLRALAQTPASGSDGDISPSERAYLDSLADAIEADLAIAEARPRSIGGIITGHIEANLDALIRHMGSTMDFNEAMELWEAARRIEAQAAKLADLASARADRMAASRGVR